MDVARVWSVRCPSLGHMRGPLPLVPPVPPPPPPPPRPLPSPCQPPEAGLAPISNRQRELRFLMHYQDLIRSMATVPVFLSSLVQVVPSPRSDPSTLTLGPDLWVRGAPDHRGCHPARSGCLY